MFTERELLILSFAVDRTAALPDQFFSQSEALALCHKIHNVLRAQRGLPCPPADWQREAAKWEI